MMKTSPTKMMMTMIVMFVLIEALDGVDYAGNGEGERKDNKQWGI